MQETINVFDDDALANSALDYLYSNDNKSKTQSFLKNNGFPSVGDRQFNKELYGVQTEQKQMRDLLKNKTNGILNPNLPNATDRAFLRGLMGEKEGERDYQNQILGANRALKDLQDAFRGTQFESGLKPITPTSLSLGEKKYVHSDTSDTTNPDEHIAFFDHGIKNDTEQYFENETFSEKIKSSKYDDIMTMLTHNQSNSTAVREAAPKAVRTSVKNAGGTVQWDAESNKAIVKINGYTEEFYVGDGYGTFIQNGTMYTDDLHLNNLIHAPRHGIAKAFYDAITDDFGKFVLRTWFFGDGSEVEVSGERWSRFINNNPQVQEKFFNVVQDSISKGEMSFDEKVNLALTKVGGGYFSGYDLINGSNKEVGGFKITGHISKGENGTYNVDISYTFNDIIDPNEQYRMDRILSEGTEKLSIPGKDYILRILGTAKFVYSPQGGIRYV